MEVRKKRHIRETNYLDDHLFEITVTEKNQRIRRPLLVDLLLIFKAALVAFLTELANFYDVHNNHQMYVTVIENNIQHGLNTGNFNVRTNPEVVATHVLNMLYNYLTSNISLRVNNSFRFNIKVLSLRHANDRIGRGSLNPHILHGTIQTGRNKKYLFYLPEGFEGFERVFSQNCSLIAIILGHYLNNSMELSPNQRCIKFKQFKEIKHKVFSRLAGEKILHEATQICSKLLLDLEGPHCLEEIGPKLSSPF